MGVDNILTVKFLKEYLVWSGAPFAFTPVWILLKALTSRRGLKAEILQPDWLVFSREPLKLFFRRLHFNMTLLILTFGPAFAYFKYIKENKPALKYNKKTPKDELIIAEAKQSLSGMIVLSAYQVFITLFKAKQGIKRTVPEAPGMAEQLFFTSLMTVVGDFHFYITHRALHSPLLYKYIHKLHHKSYNVDPFSGLSMHTAEHIVFFSVLLAGLSRRVPLWAVSALSVTLTIFPLPGHIGVWPFETFHAVHHSEFNYNYGSSQLFDELFGTTYEEYQKKKPDKRSKADMKRAQEALKQRQLVLQE